MKAEQFTEVVTEHGEGPVRLPGRGLHCVDMSRGDVLHLAEDGTVQDRYDVGRITTSRQNLSDEEAGPAGALFVVEAAARGQTVLPARI